MSWRRVGRPIRPHPDVVGFPLVKHLAAPGLATQRVENAQQTLLRPGIGALQNGREHGQQLVSRQREVCQRTGFQLARQIAVVRPVAALQRKDDRQGMANGIRGFEPRSESIAVAQTIQGAVEAVGVRAQRR